MLHPTFPHIAICMVFLIPWQGVVIKPELGTANKPELEL